MKMEIEIPEDLKVKFRQKLLADTKEGKIKWEKSYYRNPEYNHFSNSYRAQIGRQALKLLVNGMFVDGEMSITKALWFDTKATIESNGDDLDELIAAIDPTGTRITPVKTQLHQELEAFVGSSATHNPVPSATQPYTIVGEKEADSKGFWSKFKSLF
jgi:hypothetical protein